MSYLRCLSPSVSVLWTFVLTGVLCVGSAGCGSSDSGANSDTTSVAANSVRFRKDDGGKVIGVSFVGAQASDEDMKVLSEHKDVQSVMFMECPEITDKGFESLKELTSLTTLSINKASVGDAGLATLSDENTEKLTTISLTNLSLTDKGITALTVAANCEDLEFFGLSITDDALQPVAAFTKLRRLALQSCTRITGTGLAHLHGLPALTELDLRGTVLSEEGMQQLAQLPHLERLLLDQENTTDSGLADVAQLSTLKWFECVDVPISNDGLSQLSSLQDLEVLKIDKCPGITDDGLVHLGKLTALVDLTVTECPGISDAGLVHLEQLSNLKLLLVTDTGVTEAGAKEFKTKLPDCSIYYGITPNGRRL